MDSWNSSSWAFHLWFWMLLHLHQAWDGIWERRSRPWGSCPINRWYIQNFDFMFAWYRTNSWALRSLCSWTLPNFHCNWVQDEQRFSSLSSEIIPRSTHWPSSRECASNARFNFCAGLEDFFKVSPFFLPLTFRTPGILMSIASLLRAFWSRGWYIRRHPCSKDSSLVAISLWLVLLLSLVVIFLPSLQNNL